MGGGGAYHDLGLVFAHSDHQRREPLLVLRIDVRPLRRKQPYDIDLNTKFIILNAKFVILNTKFRRPEK